MLPAIVEQGNRAPVKVEMDTLQFNGAKVSFPGDQMDTMEDSEVGVMLKGLHPSGLPGQGGSGTL